MNSKKNSFKRVAAGALAVLTVAAYTAPVANVGGLPGSILTANAELATNEININWAAAKQYLTKFSQDADGTANDFTLENVFSRTEATIINKGAKITVTSKVPVTIAPNAADPDADGAYELTTKTADGLEYDGYAYDVDAKLFKKEVQGVVKTLTPDEMKVKIIKALGYDETDEAILAYSAFSKTREDNDTFTVKFKAVETKANDLYTYTFTAIKETGDGFVVAPIPEAAVVKTFKTEEDRAKFIANPGDGSIVAGTAGATLADTKGNATVEDGATTLVRGDVVTVTSENAFAVHVNNNDDKDPWIHATTSFAEGKFTATFTMPKSKTEAPISIQIVDVTETYEYTNANGVLSASTKSGSIKNAEIAAIKARSYTADEIANAAVTDFAPATESPKGTAVSNKGQAANGNTVVVYPAAAAKFLAKDTATEDPDDVIAPTVKITKDGDVLVNGDEGAATYAVGGFEGAYKFTAAGSYTVTYTVKVPDGTSTKTYDVVYTFSIAAKDAIVAEDIKLTISAKKNNVAYDLDRKVKDALTKSAVTGKTTSWMLDEAAAADVKQAGLQFTITPSIAKLDGEGGEGCKLGNTYTVEGYPSGSTFDKEYEFTVYIKDPEYGGSASNPKEIKMKWSVKDYVEGPKWNAVTDLDIAQEDTKDIESAVFAKIWANPENKALDGEKLASKVSYEYVEGVGAVRSQGQDELDTYIEGLPSEIGKYTVYAIYDDEVVSTVTVNITAYKLYIKFNEKALTKGYGEALDFSKYKLYNGKGEEVKDVTVSDIKISIYSVAEENAEGKTNYTFAKAYATKYVEGSDENNTGKARNKIEKVLVDNINKLGSLNAGKYIVVVESATVSDDKLYSVNNPEPKNGDTMPDYQSITINKKKLSDSTVKLVITPFAFDNQQHDVVADGKLYAFDNVTNQNLSKDLKITEGAKATKPGKYTGTVTLVSDNVNYEGTGNFDWAIAVKENKDINAGLVWDDTKTTLYNNGKIHTEFKRNDTEKVTLNGSTVKIEAYGVVYENEGLLQAPAAEDYGKDKKLTEDAAYKYAQDYLVLGNAKSGAYDKTTNPTAVSAQIYKNNIKVKNAETGVWVRPYLLTEDGEVKYGEIKYLNLQNEAKDKLQLQMPLSTNIPAADGKATVVTGAGVRQITLSAAEAKKPLDYVKAGYVPATDRFYAYATFVDLKKAGFSDVLDVADFGVVVDNKGLISADSDLATVSSELKIGNKINGQKLVVGHYDPNNKILDTNEYTATIKAINAATGVWVRPYLDLGNGLVVYDDPIYIPSASEYYKGKVANVVATWSPAEPANYGELTAKAAPNKFRFTITPAELADQINAIQAVATQQRAQIKADQIKAVKTGVIVDKAGSITTGDNPYTKLVLGAGFTEGRKGSKFDQYYIGTCTPTNGKVVYVRSYYVYDINGTQVTIYGDVLEATSENNGGTWTVKGVVKNEIITAANNGIAAIQAVQG